MIYCKNCGSKGLCVAESAATCNHCGAVFYFNPPSVGCAVVRVRKKEDGAIGLLLVERMDGGFGFPGGYQGPETILDAAVRELEEETAIKLPDTSERWKLLRLQTTPDHRQNLCFFLYQDLLHEEDLTPFISNSETRSRMIVRGPAKLKFSIHQEVFDSLIEGDR